MQNKSKLLNCRTRIKLKKEAKGEIFVIRPPEALNIPSVCRDPKEYKRVYDLGRRQALSQLHALEQFLNK